MSDPDPYPKVVYPGEIGPGAGYGSEKFQLLLSAISNCAVPLVHQLIQQDPGIVREKGMETMLDRYFLLFLLFSCPS